VNELWANPARFLQQAPVAGADTQRELALLALLRLAAVDPAAAAHQLQATWQQRLPAPDAALAWAVVTKQSALRLQPEAADHARRAWRQARRSSADAPFSDDLLAWQVRAALRLPEETPDRWALIEQAIAAMSPAEQADPAWSYWKARALRARARDGRDGDALRAQAQALLMRAADPLHFYGQLALDVLGEPLRLPPPPRPASLGETSAVRGHAGLNRSLQLFALGLRSEAVREWNFSLRDLGERELLAAAQWACEREVWDRCINTSKRTRSEIDIAQRYPTPLRPQVLATAAQVGVDPAYMYGLIRQESRFILDARSHVGASGLMQVMPATARYTARRVGMAYEPRMLNDRDTNLRLGASYLKIVLDDFGGQQALAAAAYNAGPGRPRRWREGGTWDAAAWAETVPFSETRDYVKKVLANAVVYSAVLGTVPAPELALRPRLGSTIGPREASAPASDRNIP
jgi:soluble lytic murein transglycosylase